MKAVSVKEVDRQIDAFQAPITRTLNDNTQTMSRNTKFHSTTQSIILLNITLHNIIQEGTVQRQRNNPKYTAARSSNIAHCTLF